MTCGLGASPRALPTRECHPSRRRAILAAPVARCTVRRRLLLDLALGGVRARRPKLLRAAADAGARSPRAFPRPVPKPPLPARATAAVQRPPRPVAASGGRPLRPGRLALLLGLRPGAHAAAVRAAVAPRGSGGAGGAGYRPLHRRAGLPAVRDFESLYLPDGRPAA